MSYRLSLVLVLTMTCLLLLARPALAWIETTVMSDEVRVEVDRSGAARVEHTMTLRVRGSTMKSLTLPGLPEGAKPVADATATAISKEGKDEGTQTLTLSVTNDGALRIDSPGLPRGVHVVKIRYDVSLLSMMEPDGGMVRVRFAGPRYPNGLDGAKAIFVFPAAGEPPRVAVEGKEPEKTSGKAESPAVAAVVQAGGVIATLRRGPERDELEVTKPHVAKNDAVIWTVKVDPRALSSVSNPSVVPPPAATVTRVVRESRTDRQVFLLVGLGIAIFVAALTAIKAKTVEERAAAHGAKARPWVPLPATVRAILAGVAFASGVACELFVHPPWIGAVVVGLSMLLMAQRAPLTKPVARGPGRWLVVADTEAFSAKVAKVGSFLDASSWQGMIGLVVALGLVAAATYGTFLVSPYHAPLAALDGLVVVALFLTGRETELPRSVEARAKRRLAKLHDALTKDPALRAVPFARFENGSTDADEVRVLVTPRRAKKGLSAIEVGIALASGSGGVIMCPSVLVRVAEETPAAEHLARRFGESRLGRGRKAGERVLVLEPRDASVGTTLAVVRVLARELEERDPAPAKRARRTAMKPALA